MKRIRCPKCHENIVFDGDKYHSEKLIPLVCTSCHNHFVVRCAKVLSTESHNEIKGPSFKSFGKLVVIENKFHYQQEFSLKMGQNYIGRYSKARPISCSIHTDDLSMDPIHCCIEVIHDKRGNLRFLLRDSHSNTGTFVDNEILNNKEVRKLYDGSIFTIGATTIRLSIHDSDSTENKKL